MQRVRDRIEDEEREVSQQSSGRRDESYRIDIEKMAFDWKRVVHANFERQAANLIDTLENTDMLEHIKHVKPAPKKEKVVWTLKGNGSASEYSLE